MPLTRASRPRRLELQTCNQRWASTSQKWGFDPGIPEHMESNNFNTYSVRDQGPIEVNLAHESRVLPKGITAKFLAEGAANIIYRISAQLGDAKQEKIDECFIHSQGKANSSQYQFPAEIWDLKLLRLRKNLEYIAPTAITYTHFAKNIKPLFDGKDLLRYDLVDLSESGIIDRLNKDLLAWETEVVQDPTASESRNEKRKGIYLAHEPYGLLVNDMSPPAGTSLVEFKPKWLCQSPAAPKGSKRCRTCAKRARDNALKGERSAFGSFCPLDLTSMDHEVLIRAAKAIFKIENPQKPEEIKKLDDFCEWAKGSVIHRLAAIQAELDPKGVFESDSEDEKFLTAMSLRDCSLFLLIPDQLNPEDPDSRYEARLGDLDVKLAVKADYWRSVELPLIEDGWYLGTEAEEVRQPLDCGLYPEFWTPASKKNLLFVSQ